MLRAVSGPATQHSYADDLRLATRLARQAGGVIGAAIGVLHPDEPVTVADRAAQRVIVAGLRDHRGTDGIIGEESETGESITATNLQPDGRNWVIDPIDGTNNFIAGVDNWAICIGLLDAGEPVVGVVYDVTRDRLYAGAKGVGATVGDGPAAALESPMSDASVFMLTSNLLGPSGEAPAWAMRLLDQTNWKVRMLGTAALESASVGAGIAHAAITVNGKIWDCVAPAAFTLAAGGVVTKPDGSALFPFDVTGYAGAKVPFLTSGKQAHAEVVERLRRG